MIVFHIFQCTTLETLVHSWGLENKLTSLAMSSAEAMQVAANAASTMIFHGLGKLQIISNPSQLNLPYQGNSCLKSSPIRPRRLSFINTGIWFLSL